MNIQKILTDPALQPLIFIPLVTFVLGITGAVVTQLLVDRRQRHVITYSQKAEIPLTLAKQELKDKLQIAYQGNKIATLYSFNIKVANTGKKMIEKQIFSCILTVGSRSIDPSFPRVTPHSFTPVQVGPINLISQTDNTYRYQIEKISVGQVVELDFLVTSDKKSDLKVEFEALEDVKYQEGDIANVPTLGTHIERLALNLILFFLFIQMIPILPFPYNGFGLISLPFIFFALRSLHRIVSILSTQSFYKRDYGIEVVAGNYSNIAVATGEGGGASARYEVPSPKESSSDDLTSVASKIDAPF